jgi:hypothetical protein
LTWELALVGWGSLLGECSPLPFAGVDELRWWEGSLTAVSGKMVAEPMAFLIWESPTKDSV